MRWVEGSHRGPRDSKSGASYASAGGPNLLASVCRRKSCALRPDTPRAIRPDARGDNFEESRRSSATSRAAASHRPARAPMETRFRHDPEDGSATASTAALATSPVPASAPTHRRRELSTEAVHSATRSPLARIPNVALSSRPSDSWRAWIPGRRATYVGSHGRHGVRNDQKFVRKENLWWLPNGSMYVHYRPTHWMPANQ